MAVDQHKRSLILTEVPRLGRKILERIIVPKGGDREEKEDYFASFENCHALLADAGDMLFEEALKRGIKVEGRTREAIARDLFVNGRD